LTQHIDIGVNLTNKSLMQNLDAVIRRATDAGVKQMVVTGSSVEDSNKAIQLCDQYPQHLVCTAGIHPHHASDWMKDTANTLAHLVENSCVRAIGETGLDFNRNYSPRDAQIEAFRRQLELAISMNRPVFAHQRDAHDVFIEILREYRNNLANIVVHCFTDTKAALFDYLDLDCHIGITGWICDERRGTELAQLVKHIPDNRLMAETDAPYLLPRDLPHKPKNRVNEPAYLPHVIGSIARHQNRHVDLVAANCLKTSQLFFGI
jgi:TatD DNase family protein